MATQQEVIKSVISSLSLTTKTGTSALDEAIRTGTNYTFSSLSDLKTQFLNDIRTVNDADTFLKDYCGIILGNEDTGAITGSDAGNGTVKTAESVVLETTGVDDWDYVAPGSTVTLSSGLKVNMPSTREDGSALTDNDLFILKGLPHWLEAGIKLNKESYGLDFSGTAVNTFNVSLYYDKNSTTLASTPTTVSSSTGKATVAGVKINTYRYSNVDVTDENGKGSTSLYLDRTLAHELNHAILAANIKNASSLYSYITEGSAELVHGVDDTRSAISVLAGDADLMDQALYSSKHWADYPTVYGGDGTKLNTPAYAGGYTLWRYMANQAATSYVKTFNGTSDAEFFETENDGVTINGAGGNDTLFNGSYKADVNGGNNVSLSGGAGDDYLYNVEGNNVTVYGGTGNDLLVSYGGYGGGSNVSLNGGTGNDTINSDYGANVSIDGGSGNDAIRSNGERPLINGGDGNDTIDNESRGDYATITGGAGADSINSIGRYVSIQGGDDNDSIINDGRFSTIDGGAGNDYISSSGDSVSIDGDAGNDTISNRSDSVTINAGAGTDSIYNDGDEVIINAGDGNDRIKNEGDDVTIYGSAGNDSIYNEIFTRNATITGGEGDDTIVFESGYTENVMIMYFSNDGNDLIRGFNATSTLQIGDGTTDTYSKATKNGNLIVSVGTGNITLTGAASLSAPNILGTEKNPLNIVGTDKAEKITNSLASATIQALGGNDTVKNTGASVSINGGADNDSINNSGAKVTILGDAGNDKIQNSGSSAKINAGAGNDSIRNTAASVSIVGGAGKDSITNTKTKVTINAGTGNDRIVNSAASVSIIAGTGNDLVSLGANAKNNFITYSSGNDTIKGFNATSTLKIGDGSDTYSKDTDDNDVILTVGDYSVTLTGAASLTNPKILGEEITATVYFTDDDAAKQTLASGVEVADATERTAAIRIVGNALDNDILGGSGKDTLYGGNGDDYLEGNAGNDKLYGQAGDDYLEGGAGADLLSGYSGDDTLWGGGGNDTLTGGAGSDTFIYVKGDGKDVITDFGDDDLLEITGTWTAAYNSSTNNVTFKVGSTASALTLKNVEASEFNINDNTYYISGTKLVK